MIKIYIKKILINFIKKIKLATKIPMLRYKVLNFLIQQGDLNSASNVLERHREDIKDFEKEIVSRIEFMKKIKEEGLTFSLSSYISPLKIHPLFIVHNSLPYDKAGYAIRTHSIVTQLKKELDLEVITRAGYPWDLKKYKDLKFKASDIIDGIEYIRTIDKNKMFKKGSDLAYINIYAEEIVKVVKNKESTILHASSNYFNGLAMLKANEKLNLPTIYEMRGLWHVTRLTLDPKFKYNGMYEYEGVMEKSIALHASKVITISEALKTLISSWGVDKSKVVVIPNAVDLKRFIPLSKDIKLLEQYHIKNKFIIGFIGSISAYEGLEELIKSVQEINKEGYREIVLMIVGDGRELEKLKKKAKSNNIIFTGRVPFEKVNNYYSIFDVCIYPRRDEEVCRYVPPLKPLEAMAMKKAIIVSDVSPLLEMVEDGYNGLVCKANDIESLKEKIIRLYENQDLKEKLSKNALAWVKENRSWDLVSQKYIELYNSFKEDKN